MDLVHIIRKLEKVLNIEADKISELIDKDLIRIMNYKDITYALFRKDRKPFLEGTTVLLGKEGERIIYGYPSIKRILLLSSIPNYFIDEVVVEEKMDGYNVRIVEFEGNILAISRGGYVCPYTTHKLNTLYGDSLKEIFERMNSDFAIVGEVIGLENPYVPHRYPESPRFDFYAFDTMDSDGRLMPLKERDKLLLGTDLKVVKKLAHLDKFEIDTIKRVVNFLETEGREGIVFKDPYHRVPPLKYSTSYANINDIRVGMKFFFEEGRSYLFSRILREIFKAAEENIDRHELVKRATALGLSILEPAVESVKKVMHGDNLNEEYTLTIQDEEVINDIVDFMHDLHIGFDIAQLRSRNGEYVIKLVKLKKTEDEIRNILKSGYTPMD
jgi:putative ATP-dependent DNA ligase